MRNIDNIPPKNATCAGPNPMVSMPPGRSSTKETITITPAAKPKVMVIKRGPGSFLVATPIRPPMPVDNPARVVNIKAVPTFGIICFYPLTEMPFLESDLRSA